MASIVASSKTLLAVPQAKGVAGLRPLPSGSRCVLFWSSIHHVPLLDINILHLKLRGLRCAVETSDSNG